MVDDSEMAEMLQLSWSFFWPRPRLGNKVISLFKTEKWVENNGAPVFFDSLLFFKKHNTEINVSNVVAGMDLSFPIFLLLFTYLVRRRRMRETGVIAFVGSRGKRKRGRGVPLLLLIWHGGNINSPPLGKSSNTGSRFRFYAPRNLPDLLKLNSIKKRFNK